jgi:hypothetical protein
MYLENIMKFTRIYVQNKKVLPPTPSVEKYSITENRIKKINKIETT